jgi:HAD superfamily hydrolase (TIGR01549 family)
MADDDRTFIFDIDGTLVDSAYLHAMAWQRAFRECGLEIATWRVHRAIGMGGDRLVAALFGDVVENRVGDELRARWSAAYEEVSHDVRPLPGARPLLERRHQDGHQVCVASSGSRRDTEEALDILQVRGILDGVTTGDDADSSKPAPDVVQSAWERSGRGPATVVGDTVYDVEAASALGLPCVAVRTGGFGVDELVVAGAVHVADDLAVLLDDEWPALMAARADPVRPG